MRLTVMKAGHALFDELPHALTFDAIRALYGATIHFRQWLNPESYSVLNGRHLPFEKLCVR